MLYIARVTAGRRRFSQPPRPNGGSHWSCTENSRSSMIPSQKFGMLWPISATSIAAWSTMVPRRAAATIPAGMATIAAVGLRRVEREQQRDRIAGRVQQTEGYERHAEDDRDRLDQATSDEPAHVSL